MTHFITAMMAGISGAAMTLTAVSAACTRLFLRQKPSIEFETVACGVSILKPLKGLERETRENLESFFWLNYPKFELIFCVQDANDPAVETVRALMRSHPDVPACLITGGKEVGPNPKINNLLPGFQAARYETILISDSNIRVGSQYVSELESQLAGREMVCSVVFGQMPTNLMGRIEEVFLGGFYARFMVLTKYLGRPCMMGKSLLFRRAAMVAIGGLEALAPYLAEDLVAGEKFTQAGFQIGLSRYPVFQVIGRPSFATFWNRHLRWGQIRKTHASLLFLIELPFTNAFIAASFASISAASLGFSGPLAFAGFLATWVSFDLWAIRAGSGSLKWHQPFSCLMREALRIPLWVHIALSSRVTWKGRSFQMGKDGRLMSLRRAETDEQSEDAALPIRSWRQGASSSESDTRR